MKIKSRNSHHGVKFVWGLQPLVIGPIICLVQLIVIYRPGFPRARSGYSNLRDSSCFLCTIFRCEAFCMLVVVSSSHEQGITEQPITRTTTQLCCLWELFGTVRNCSALFGTVLHCSALLHWVWEDQLADTPLLFSERVTGGPHSKVSAR